MKSLTMLTMKDANDDIQTVCIDTDRGIDYGGFGTIYAVSDRPKLVVKHMKLERPEPVGNLQRYVAHIKATRARLLRIKTEEERGYRRPFIIECINEIVGQSLSTHWYFDSSAGTKLAAVWFLQKRAPGRKLLELFREILPPVDMRKQIALGLVSRIRTLRRAGLVHLDCVAENIFVDLETKPPRVTMIDLDGCGIEDLTDGAEAGRRDEWEHRPFTLGHTETMRVPPWYPQVGVAASPRAGNYLFAERWVVLDTLIRILTWNRRDGALSWIRGVLGNQIRNVYKDIRKRIGDAETNGHPYDVETWTTHYTQVLNQLRGQFDVLPHFKADDDEPACLSDFAELAQKAYVDPRAALSASGDSSFYERYITWLRQ